MLLDDHPVVRAGLRAIVDSFPDLEVVAEGSTGAAVDDMPAEVDVVAAVEAGALGYLLKDAPEDDLHAAIVATASGKRTLAPDVAAQLAERVVRPREALSGREIEILKALATGASNKQLAQGLFISEATVKTHLIHIYQKLGVDNRTAAVNVARERKLV